MKKPYEKPALFAESFALVEHIATPCDGANAFGTPVNAQDASGCGFQYKDTDDYYPGLTLFNTALSNFCDVDGMHYEVGRAAPFGTS